MKNLYKIKQISIIIIIIIIGAIVFSLYPKNKEISIPAEEKTVNETKDTKTISLCYYRADKTDRGFYDKAWLKLNILGDKVTGEFQHLPAESDSKIGEFTGTILPANSTVNEKSAIVWWESRAEGMEIKEELAIKFGAESATVGFGEMVDSQLGDGVYLYKDKTKLYWIKGMNQTDCDSIDEKVFVEQYVRDNIGKIATDKPVLGGTWYILTVVVNPSLKTGEVTYEDGHIQSKATFTYLYEASSQKITITKFEIKK